MKKYHPFKKLVTGIILFSSFHYLNHILGGADGLYTLERLLKQFFERNIGKEIGDFLAPLILLPIPIFMVYAFVSGLYRLCTFTQYIPTFEDKTPGGTPIRGHTSYPNINRILSYRESALAGKSPEEAADLYIASSKIEGLYNGSYNGPNTQQTLSYIESRLSGMSGERGLNYLSNKL